MTLGDEGAGGSVALAEHIEDHDVSPPRTSMLMLGGSLSRRAERWPESDQDFVVDTSRAALSRRSESLGAGSRVKQPAPKGLPERLERYRNLVAQAWSPSTKHPSFRTTQDDARPASSRGQCGVTSAWLLYKLNWPQRIRARYCFGDILVHEGMPRTMTFHCWVEIGWSAKRLVIDLTCDQFEVFAGESVLCESYDSLMERSIEYRAVSRRTLRKLKKDLVWDRFEELRDNVRGIEENSSGEAAERTSVVGSTAVLDRSMETHGFRPS